VENEIGREDVGRLVELVPIGDVELSVVRALDREVVPGARRQVVDREDGGASLEVALGEVRADEACAASYQDSLVQPRHHRSSAGRCPAVLVE
jgi:hypothetical protein